MNLNEYIKRNYKNPNVQVLKTLGASDDLISYLIHTPWNTNLNIVDLYCGESTESINSLVFEMGDVGGDRTLINADCITFQTLIEQTKNGQIVPKLSGTATVIYQEQTINLNFSEEALQYGDYTSGIGVEGIETEDTQVVLLTNTNESPCVMASYGGIIPFSSGRLEVTW